MNIMYWRLNKYCELLQRSLKQTSSICKKPKNFNSRRSWRLLRCWIKKFLDLCFFSWNILIPHKSFWEKLFHLTFWLLLKNMQLQLIFIQPLIEIDLIPYNVLRLSLHDHCSSVYPWPVLWRCHCNIGFSILNCHSMWIINLHFFVSAICSYTFNEVFLGLYQQSIDFRKIEQYWVF